MPHHRPNPRSIAVPAYYRDIISELYEGLGVPVSFEGGRPTSSEYSSPTTRVNGRGYGAIAFDGIGANAEIELHQALQDVRALGASAIQLSARVDDPRLSELVVSARERGFFFCGLGPAFADGADTILLQCLTEPLDTSKLQLFTERAKRLVTFIDRDREEVLSTNVQY